MAEGIVTVLNTAIAEAGPSQSSDHVYLKRDRVEGGTRFFVDLSAGDTVLIQGKAAAADNWATLQSITADGCYDVKLAPLWRVSRSVDGTAGEAVVKAINLHNQPWQEHTA